MNSTHSELAAGLLSDQVELLAGPPAAARPIDLDECWDKTFRGLVIHPLAFLYSRSLPGNRWFGNPVLLEAVKNAGDRFFAEIASQRSCLWMRRTGYHFIHAFDLIQNELDNPDRWRDSIIHFIRDSFFPEVRERETLTRFSSANVGYGTNHLAVELSMLCAFVTAFKDDALRQRAMPGCNDPTGYLEDYLDRFMTYMEPGGYWPEADGPTHIYNSLTASSLLRCAIDLGIVETYRSHFECAAHFQSHYLFANLMNTGITDGRNRQSDHLACASYLGFLPEGKPLLRLIRNRMQNLEPKDKLSGETLAEILTDINAEPFFVSEEAGLTWETESFTDTIGDDFGLLKRKSWMVAWSNFRFRPRPEGHFNLDYQNLFSLYHRRFGTVFSGNNSKNDPALSTFNKVFTSFDGEPLDQPMPKYIPERGWFEIREDGFVLMREYRGFEGQLDFRIRSDTEAELRINANTRLREYPITCSLQPACGFERGFSDGNGKEISIGPEPFALSGDDLGGAIVLRPEQEPDVTSNEPGRAVKLTIPADARLVWPFKGWDTYNLKTDRQTKPSGWTCILQIPISRDGARVVIELLP